MMRRFAFQIFWVVSGWAMLSCGGADEAVPSIRISFAAPPRLAAVQGMTAKVEISDVGTFDLTVATDGSASGEIRDVPVGSRKMTIRYYKDVTVLAEVGRTLDLAVGQRVEVKITPADFKYPDSDGNGVSNLDEILKTQTTTSIAGTGTTTPASTTSSSTTVGSTGTPISSSSTGTVDSSSKGEPKIVLAETKVVLEQNNEIGMNGLFDPGDDIVLDLILRNDGTATAQGVQGNLSTVPFIVNPSGDSLPVGDDCLSSWSAFGSLTETYPDLAPGQSSGIKPGWSDDKGYGFTLSRFTCPAGSKTLYLLFTSMDAKGNSEGKWTSTLAIQIQPK